MRVPVALFPVVLLIAASTAFPKDKKEKRPELPLEVLQARTAMVVIAPNAGEPLKDPQANARAQEDVERALMKWRRFKVVSEPSLADLVISVRRGTGNAVSPTVRGGPIDQRPIILQPTDGSIRIGGHTGQPTDASGQDPIDSGPHVSSEYGTADDALEVYRGRLNLDATLEGSPVWRYAAKDSLKPPKVAAVEQFRKAIEASEKTDPNKGQP